MSVAEPRATAPEPGWRRGFALSARLLMRDWRAGELRVLALGLVVAVASVTTVAFFTDRVRQALSVEASQLLGADLLVVSDRPLDAQFVDQARALGLTSIQTVRFPSMVLAGESSVLTEVKAVAPGYPLKGRLLLRDSAAGSLAQRPAIGPPPVGAVWVDERLLSRLGVGVGDELALGERRFQIAAMVVEDPETNVGFLNLGPRLMLNALDLGSTGLIQVGSRVSYRLGVAGPMSAVREFRQFAADRIGPGQRVEDIRDARPEIRTALERAERFLGLSTLLSVMLAAVAVALAARQYLRRHLDACAVMRCFGASQNLILRLHLQQFVLLALLASAGGCLLGFAGQWALSALLQPLVGASLPWPSAWPVLLGFAGGMVLLLGFALPPLVALRKVPTLRVLRRDIGMPDRAGIAGYALGLVALAGLVLWQAQDVKVAIYVLVGALATMLVCGAAVWGMVRGIGWSRGRGGFAWRFGLANLRRRPLSTVVQVTALGLGILALTLLTLVRSDLLANWERSLPPDAPNRFLVNIQPDQVAELKQFMLEQQLPQAEIFPMVRGRLSAINGRKVSSADYVDDRARRLVDREFNLSWANRLQPDNAIVAGRWWRDSAAGTQDKALFSVEEGIAETLGVAVGDRLTYDIAGSVLEGEVASLRKVEWDSFRVNFFVVTPPGVLEPFPASFVTSFHVPPARSNVMDRLVKRFPNFLVIDVAEVLARVQRIMDQVVKAVEFVFLFALLAGLIVLFAAISATHDERVYDAAILRTLGATGKQLLAAQSAEFTAIGACAGLLAAIGATLLGYVLASQIFHIPYVINPLVWLAGLAGGTLGVLAAGLLGTRRVLSTPPIQTFREAM